MEATTVSGDKKEAQELAKKNKKKVGSELMTHGQSDNEEGVHGTQYDNNDPLSEDNMGIENTMNCKSTNAKKLSWQEEDELICKLENALCYMKWDLVERLVMGSSVHVLNVALCMSLGSIWFLSTHEELSGLTTLIKKIVLSGASNFRRAAVFSSLLASLVTVLQSETLSLGKFKAIPDLREEFVDMILKIRNWATIWNKKHQGSSDPPETFAVSKIQLQLTTFRTFLDLAESRLTVGDFAQFLRESCSCSVYSVMIFGTSATARRDLLNMLVERGADNVNECILLASQYDFVELVRILLQIARLNGQAVNVNLALAIAAENSRLDTMNALVDEGQITSLVDLFVMAVKRGCIPVVSWLVNKGCSNEDLCTALSFAVAYNQLECVEFLLSKIPLEVRNAFSNTILIAATDNKQGSFNGVAFLLSSNFLGSPDVMYTKIERFIDADVERAFELTTYLKNNWSKSSYHEGVRVADDHYVNVMRVLKRGCSRIQLRELPAGIPIAIALLPLYRECLKVEGELLPLRLKGELVRSLHRFGCHEAEAWSTKGELMTMLERLLPSFAVLK